MTTDAQKPTLKSEIDRWLKRIDAGFTDAGLELSQRPLLAAVEFVDQAVIKISGTPGGSKPPGNLSEFVTEPWFRAIFQHSQLWYEERYGSRINPRDRDIKAVVPVMGIACLLNVPGSLVRPDVPGETIWLTFPAVIEVDENPMSWLVEPPNLKTGDPEDASRARKIAREVAGNIRAINSRLTGVAHNDPAKTELLAGVVPGLQRAAELQVQGDEQALKSAHWEIQMAVERAFKALTQERSGRFDETHDLFILFDRLPGAPLALSRDQLKKLPAWRQMAELRYGGGPARSSEETFAAYRAALKIVLALAKGFAALDLSQAGFKLQKPPWMRPLDEVFHVGKPPIADNSQESPSPSPTPAPP